MVRIQFKGRKTDIEMADSKQTKRNHYVPKWYQKRFLSRGKKSFLCLDLHPETITLPSGKRHQMRSLFDWGPNRCFRLDDLYTVKLGVFSNDEIERRFFGPIDNEGKKAVEFYADFSMRSGFGEAFNALLPYMDAQRFRTPRGLDWLKSLPIVRDRNSALVAMQQVFQFHATMWTEGVWEIVKARKSPTKFLLTDQPVTFYNAKAFPMSANCRYPGDVGLDKIGTRTLFPLGLDSCLIITHVQLVRNPWENPRKPRVNARSYVPTMCDLSRTQFGRELEEDEVRRINLILKQRATRYVAAIDEEWLYPEKTASTKHWSKLDDEWFLLPHLYKVPFSGGIVTGNEDGSSWAMDEHGRTPDHPDYRDQNLHDKEWAKHLEARVAWAIKREGRSVARMDKFRDSGVDDKIMKGDIEAYRASHIRRKSPPKTAR